MRPVTLAASLLLLCAALAQSQQMPDVTEDGLVRAPSGSKVGVYRAPGVAFTQYQRIALAPIKVEFKKDWQRKHPELTAKERDKLSADLAQTFRDELIKELVERGGYQLTEESAPDVLRVEGLVLNTDVTAPKASAAQQQRTYVSSAGSMKVVIDLKDAASGAVVARLINYEKAPERGDPLSQMRGGSLPPASSEISNLADFRIGFEKSARYTHEALSVAKATKREEQSQIKSEY